MFLRHGEVFHPPSIEIDDTWSKSNPKEAGFLILLKNFQNATRQILAHLLLN